MNIKKYIFSALASVAISTIASAQNCQVSLAVAPITQGEDVPDGVSEYLESRLAQLITNEDAAVDPAIGQFFIAGKFNHISENVLPGPPIQTALHTYLTLYIGDIQSKTIYASTTVELRGVGTSGQRAFINAMRAVNERNSKIEKFLNAGRSKVLDYFNKNINTIIAKANRAAQQKRYDEALWILSSVPECCNGYAKVSKLEQEYFSKYIGNEGTKILQQARAAWAASQNREGARTALALLSLIDVDSSAYPAANQLIEEIRQSIHDDKFFEEREKYNNSVETEQLRIDAIRQIGVAYGRGQQPTTTNLNWIR